MGCGKNQEMAKLTNLEKACELNESREGEKKKTKNRVC